LLDLADKEGLRLLAALVADLRKIAPDVDLLLVGAAARDVLLSYAHGIALARATHDVDLAFAIANWPEFEALRGRLVESGLFKEWDRIPHRLRHHSSVRLDLIPFGGVERPDGTIAWPPEYAEVMEVFGYAEAQASAIEVRLPDNQILPVVALPMLALLKVLAWADRHLREPRKDAADLFAILRNYLDTGQDERLYSEAAHLLDDPAFDYRVAGAWLTGYDARVLIERHSHRSEHIVDRLTSVLVRESDIDGPLSLVSEASGIDAEYARRLLAAFLAGFSGKKMP
jgi:predicted nucleotidyltransferase